MPRTALRTATLVRDGQAVRIQPPVPKLLRLVTHRHDSLRQDREGFAVGRFPVQLFQPDWAGLELRGWAGLEPVAAKVLVDAGYEVRREPSPAYLPDPAWERLAPLGLCDHHLLWTVQYFERALFQIGSPGNIDPVLLAAQIVLAWPCASIAFLCWDEGKRHQFAHRLRRFTPLRSCKSGCADASDSRIVVANYSHGAAVSADLERRDIVLCLVPRPN